MNILRSLGWNAEQKGSPNSVAYAGDVHQNANIIQQTLAGFNIPVEVTKANIGPASTGFLLRLPLDVKVDRVKKYETNIALNLSALCIRIVPSLSDNRLVSIEVPNARRRMVILDDLLADTEVQERQTPLSFIVGEDVMGKIVTANLATMPHLMIAGQTGSGKTIMLNNILANLLLKNTPETLQLVLIDPKQVEFAPYSGIPHLLFPVIKEPEEWEEAQHWVEHEVSLRMRLLSENSRTDIDNYNSTATKPLPHIVIITDEFSDMMMCNGNENERFVAAVTPNATASGIHMVISTSRPSDDVYTVPINKNFTARMAFATASSIDSQTILGETDAEKLLGQGDLLFKISSDEQPKRIQAAYISDDEVQRLVEDLGKKLQ